MRAVVVQVQPERRLVLKELPEPSRGKAEILVRVQAVSLNRGEVYTALNSAPEGQRIGADFSGVVEGAPENSGFASGKRVVGLMSGGAWAERVVVLPTALAGIPDSVSFEQAAALPVAGLTAKLALEKGSPLAGQQVLITGATGGVGMLAVQLAAHAGADVTVLVRSDALHERMKELGARTVAINSTQAAARGPYNLIFESVGGPLLGEALGWLASRGICVLVGNAGGSMTTFDADRFRMGDGGAFGGTTLYGFFLREERQHTVLAEQLGGLLQKVADGSLNPMIGAAASWTNVHEVATGLLARQFFGKAVLTLDG